MFEFCDKCGAKLRAGTSCYVCTRKAKIENLEISGKLCQLCGAKGREITKNKYIQDGFYCFDCVEKLESKYIFCSDRWKELYENSTIDEKKLWNLETSRRRARFYGDSVDGLDKMIDELWAKINGIDQIKSKKGLKEIKSS